jgi:hypothetical protein
MGEAIVMEAISDENRMIYLVIILNDLAQTEY